MLYRQQIKITTDASFSTRPGLAIRRVPVTVARFALKAYAAQAMIGFAIGFAVPILRTMGVF